MKRKSSVISTLIGLCLIPAIIALVGSIITAYQHMKSSTEAEIEESLMAVGYTLLETFDATNNGNYWLSNNVLFKGGRSLSDSNDIVDFVKEKTEIECTLFYGDTRYMTTVLDENGDRMLLTQCSDTVKEIVLEQGNTSLPLSAPLHGFP